MLYWQHNAKNQFGCSAMHCAAENGQMNTIRSLLLRGARIGEMDFSGRTALELAYTNGHINVVSEILALEVIHGLFAALSQPRTSGPQLRIEGVVKSIHGG